MASDKLFSEDYLDQLNPNKETEQGPVTVFGLTFKNDEERRQYFRDELRRRLPELRQIEGFPIGEDDDIINLSDPPYYTACPNPWLNDFIQQWEDEKKQLQLEGKRKADFDVKEPYASDIKEGKNSAIYNAHFYHTKVPHQAIMRYLLHYTQPGDIVLDNFAGTGMTGVAANELSKPMTYTNLIAGNDGKWGFRNCILNDLSPFASFITYNYTHSVNKNAFHKAAKEILDELKNKFAWTYQTKHSSDVFGEVNYFVWSEVQTCPFCGRDFTYWDAAVNLEKQKVLDIYPCPHCGTMINKKDSVKSTETIYDASLNSSYEQIRYVPVLVNYSVGKKRHERPVSEFDTELVERIQQEPFKTWFPNNPMMGIGEKWGDTWRAGYHIGFNHVHNFYSKRNLIILSYFYELICNYNCDARLKAYLKAWFTSSQSRLHIMNRYAAKHHRHVGPLANTLYVSGTPTEISPFYFIESKISDNFIDITSNYNVTNQVASASSILLDNNSVDYIFTDPPFGGNIMYSELNFIYESWLKVLTNNGEEAITNDSQHKDVMEYQRLMLACFKEYFRLLKPGKWMTVEFSNTSAAIWNSIQNTIKQAGFVIASVSDLNKGRGGLHGITTTTAVKQDLAISCYKPSYKIQSFTPENGIQNAWDFIEDYIDHLPPCKIVNGKLLKVMERDPRILYDRLISYFVQRGFNIPFNSTDFQNGLSLRYIQKDDMFFTASQAAEYDKLKLKAFDFVPMGIMVSDEANGIEWLKNQLRDKSQTYQEIYPEFIKALNGVRKGDQIPGLDILLEENFIQNEDGTWRLPNVDDDVDLEKLRTKALLKEFKLYLEVCRKPRGKLKDVRVEAVRAGFKQCYSDKNFAEIILVGDRIPQNLLTEDEILLQYYDIASSKV